MILVSMSRDELKVWRKEARRVRNRESAAASRLRTRSKIEELESKLNLIQKKYSAALQRISELESGENPKPTQQENIVEGAKEVFAASVTFRDTTTVVSPKLMPNSSAIQPHVLFDMGNSHCSHHVDLGNNCRHINMISTPSA